MDMWCNGSARTAASETGWTNKAVTSVGCLGRPQTKSSWLKPSTPASGFLAESLHAARVELVVVLDVVLVPGPREQWEVAAVEDATLEVEEVAVLLRWRT